MSYAVIWSEDHGPVHAGCAEVADGAFRLAGSAQLVYTEVGSTRIGRAAGDRLAGRPTLVIETGEGTALRVASLEGTGRLLELADEVELRRGIAADA